MKTKILAVASVAVFGIGGALHMGSGQECPFGKPCQKLFKSAGAPAKSELVFASKSNMKHERKCQMKDL